MKLCFIIKRNRIQIWKSDLFIINEIEFTYKNFVYVIDINEKRMSIDANTFPKFIREYSTYRRNELAQYRMLMKKYGVR
jgi:hypothetical protein